MGRWVWGGQTKGTGEEEMSEPEKFDALVIGSGQGGTPLVYALAAAGRKTALI
jgi:cation diffusion facilitator CzcD-associated flavoprotein CzcO